MHRRQTTVWSWGAATWVEILCPTARAFKQRYPWTHWHARQMLAAAAYLCGWFEDFRQLGIINRTALASRVFGRSRVDAAIQRVVPLLRTWGYGPFQAKDVQWALCTALLANKSPRLEDLTVERLEAELTAPRVGRRGAALVVLSRALAGLGVLPRGLPKRTRGGQSGDARNGVAPEWTHWVERWRATCTLQTGTRTRHYLCLMKAGRWITATHPACTAPACWTRETAAQWVATVCRMCIGDWTQIDRKFQKHRGKPLSAKARAHHLSSLSTFFRDLQEWEWLPRRFDPRRAFATPRSLRALIAPNPRVIADDIWAKLLWAGLHLAEADLTTSYGCGKHYYPLALVRALTVVWLFAGLRMDEIRRLHVGCTRLQRSQPAGEAGALCELTVPVNKTSTAFSKPVDRVVGEAVRLWEAERPAQPPALDAKTGELVDFLFAFRGMRIAATYVNHSLVPMLCQKAGVPLADARGKITSHRARSTIASQLFNAKEPMSLFELQQWLGHRWAASTQYYLAISPTKLAASYRDAGYFARNVRAIEVLIDREVVTAGAAGQEPWKFYDLGHGYCTYDFFEQCPHRMACAKCPFYRPKGSAQAQLLEGKANLLRLRQEITLGDAELAAVDDGLAAFERLLTQLADVPTPAGPTPRQLRDPEGDQGSDGTTSRTRSACGPPSGAVRLYAILDRDGADRPSPDST